VPSHCGTGTSLAVAKPMPGGGPTSSSEAIAWLRPTISIIYKMYKQYT